MCAIPEKTYCAPMAKVNKPDSRKKRLVTVSPAARMNRANKMSKTHVKEITHAKAITIESFWATPDAFVNKLIPQINVAGLPKSGMANGIIPKFCSEIFPRLLDERSAARAMKTRANPELNSMAAKLIPKKFKISGPQKVKISTRKKATMLPL
jgi:hypothetical protein